MTKVIYNCHNHLFTHENIPEDYYKWLGISFVKVARNKYARRALRGVMKGIIPFSKNDKLNRYANFLKFAYQPTQEENLRRLLDYYPPDTRFVILPMDMSEMGAGKVLEDIDDQHAELTRLAKKYPDVVIPFAHIEPRRDDPLGRLQRLVEEDGYKGVKIYPTLGYPPDHPLLMREIYPYMVEHNIPLIAHCSPGVVNNKDMKPKDAHLFADPMNYKPVMDAFPDLRICLAHFGGISEWRRHIDEPKNLDNPTWLTKIQTLLRSGDYPNLYVDISYTIFNFTENVPLLKLLLLEPAIREKVLFGSDFYMVEAEKMSERKLAIYLRAELGEELFWTIANENPKIFLEGTPDADEMISKAKQTVEMEN